MQYILIVYVHQTISTLDILKRTGTLAYKGQQTDQELQLSNSYTMCCPPVCEDNPRALASGLSYVQADKHGITILYHLQQCRPCTSRDISCLTW